MQLIKSYEDNCLLCSAAMLLDVSAEALMSEIGHDGQEVLWPNAFGSFKKRGFHIQEILNCFFARGRGLVLVEAMPQLAPDELFVMTGGQREALSVFELNSQILRICELLNGRPALILSRTHAVAWDGSLVYDPNGEVYRLEEMQMAIREIYFVVDWK